MGFNPSITIAASIEPLSFDQLQRLSDEQLMLCLQAGQSNALAVLFDRYERLVLSIALKIVRDSGEAEDVTQTVFLDIYRAVAQFDPAKGSTKVWLMQYAYHRAIHRRQYLQARSFYQQTDFEELEAELIDHRAISGLSTPESKALVRQGIARLTGKQKSVIELACFDGLSMQEIADKTGDSFANVRHHYYRGLEKLRSFILGDGNVRRRENGGING